MARSLRLCLSPRLSYRLSPLSLRAVCAVVCVREVHWRAGSVGVEFSAHVLCTDGGVVWRRSTQRLHSYESERSFLHRRMIEFLRVEETSEE